MRTHTRVCSFDIKLLRAFDGGWASGRGFNSGEVPKGVYCCLGTSQDGAYYLLQRNSESKGADYIIPTETVRDESGHGIEVNGGRNDNPRRGEDSLSQQIRYRKKQAQGKVSSQRGRFDELDTDKTYTVRGYPGIAFYTRGYVVEEKEIFDHGYTGEYEEVEDRSRAVMVMVGDDRKHIVDIDDLTLLPEDGYCQGCGQIGCGHDVRG